MSSTNDSSSRTETSSERPGRSDPEKETAFEPLGAAIAAAAALWAGGSSEGGGDVGDVGSPPAAPTARLQAAETRKAAASLALRRKTSCRLFSASCSMILGRRCIAAKEEAADEALAISCAAEANEEDRALASTEEEPRAAASTEEEALAMTSSPMVSSSIASVASIAARIGFETEDVRGGADGATRSSSDCASVAITSARIRSENWRPEDRREPSPGAPAARVDRRASSRCRQPSTSS